MKKETKQKVREAVVKGIQRNAERIFSTSQDTAACYVPKDRGILADSGYTRPLPNGAEIGYTAPYARVIEFGAPAKPFVGISYTHIPEHIRTSKAGKKYKVKPHDRKYDGARVIVIRPKLAKFEFGDPVTVVMTGLPEREPHLFLTRAVQKEIHELPEDIKFYLKRLGKVD